jgi:hypothetical protein
VTNVVSVTKEELLAKLEELNLYSPTIEGGNDSDCPCCRTTAYAYMQHDIYGEYLSVHDVRALLNSI